jgi:NitT/TauT family transport system substrate-binding protein
VTTRRIRSIISLFAVLLTFASAAAACGGDDEPTSVEVILGWLAEPSRGGLFAAEQQGYYDDAGLDVTLNPGTDISAVQLVGAGRAEFGIGDADELLSAREEGIPVVAVATTFQTNPRILVYHSSNPVMNYSELNSRTVYLDLGDDWWEWVKAEYELDDVDERAYTGQLANFIADENALVQGYVGSEDLVLAEEGVSVGVLRVGESGFDPYSNILFTTESFIEENPDIVRDMVEATNRGWDYYKDNYAEVNEFLQTFNEELTLSSMNGTALAQEDFIYGGDAATEGVGYMTLQRWQTLDTQLRDLGIISGTIDLNAIFTTEFLE